MSDFIRPYIIIPRFVEQPTWGGGYIAQFKNWQDKFGLSQKKIGQSYELYGKSLLSTALTDTANEALGPVYSASDIPGTPFIKMAELVNKDPEKILGKYVWDTFHTMPILIKFTQALGNSFQLHIKSGTTDPHWKPKPESWYFLENGKITYGINPETDIAAYKQTCLKIDEKMHDLSRMVMTKEMNLETARSEAHKFISGQNPWQYVNVYKVDAGTLVDLSPGGLHHSWEEDAENPLGNIVYEVQMDTADDVSTMRSFDQGKLKDDGSVRNLSIDEYFQYIDTDTKSNTLKSALGVKKGSRLLSTKWYAMDELEINNTHKIKTNDSFMHLFVRKGAVEILTPETNIRLMQGYSCFIPCDVKAFQIRNLNGNATVFNTYIDSNFK